MAPRLPQPFEGRRRHGDASAKPRLAPDDPQSARAKTLSVFALMVGTLQLSRAMADRELADVVLEHGIQNALALLGADQLKKIALIADHCFSSIDLAIRCMLELRRRSMLAPEAIETYLAELNRKRAVPAG